MHELSIPWSDVGGIQHATLFMGDVCGKGDLPTSVTVRLWSDHASIHAMDASGVEQDSAMSTAPWRAQDLKVSYGGGIRTVEIRGSQMATESICWECGPTGPDDPEFRRGETSGDGVVNIQDAIDILRHVVLGSVEFRCEDAADVDDSGNLNVADAIRLLQAIVLGFVTVPAPGMDKCGVDPTDDALSCELYKPVDFCEAP